MHRLTNKIYGCKSLMAVSFSLQIYISLEGVDSEKVDATFRPTSVDIKMHEVQGKNYRCAIAKLNKEIDPDRCKILVKPLRVILTLQKASKGNWLDLHYKEDKVNSFFLCYPSPFFGGLCIKYVWIAAEEF